MKYLNLLKLPLICIGMALLFNVQLFAQEESKPEEKKDKEEKVYPRPENWSVYGTAYYTSRRIKGNISRKNTLNNGISSDLVATGTTLDLDRSNGFMYLVGASYKRWFLGLTFMPSLFEDQGNGFSYVDLTGPNGNGVLTQISTVTNVHIDMYLANITYEAVRTKHTTFKVGIGAGGSTVKLHITPQSNIVNEIRFNHTQPFGYVTLNMATEYRRFIFSANMNGVSMKLDGVKIGYLDFNVELGYRAYQGFFNLDIIGGYRMVNFAISGSEEVDGPPDSMRDVNVDLTLEGPFLGVTLSY